MWDKDRKEGCGYDPEADDNKRMLIGREFSDIARTLRRNEGTKKTLGHKPNVQHSS